ncbi:DUF4232 domain-containing protein [Kitasatospora sp. NPDC004799]|uniref:DUF4232 domain-containing protein n=1 Tax=Kitasatospora sp. NPDC004799 TaxID=3154460 RepID=UPI00339E019C
MREDRGAAPGARRGAHAGPPARPPRPGPWLRGLRPRTVRARIIALLMVPVVSVIALWGFATVTTAQGVWDLLRQRDAQRTLLTPVAETVAGLQAERTAAGQLLAAPTGAPTAARESALRQAAAATDRALGAPAAGAPAGAAPAATGTARPKNPVAPATGGTAAAGGDEAYAYTHPCEATKLTVKVTTRAEAPDQRVIEVRNQGTAYCGLSYYPLVSLGSSKAADHGKDLTPLVPGGLGGPPAYALAAGQTAYAVVDLNPAGGTVADVDQLNVLPDDQLPNADTRNFPLGAGAKVGKQPKLGLYGRSVADAAASAALAGQG